MCREALLEISKNLDWEDEGSKVQTLANLQILLESLSDDEQKMMLSLFKKYSLIPFRSYLEKLKALGEIPGFKALLSQHDEIYLMPVTTTDEDKVKSGDSVAYPFKKILSSDKVILTKLKTVRPGKWANGFKAGNSLAIFIDDFVGTGASVKKCMDRFAKDSFTSQIVVTISITDTGLKFLNDLGVQVLYSHLEKKAFDSGDDKADKVLRDQFVKLCKKLKITKKYHFGYEKNEALISLLNTPNNTLGVFWFSGGHFNPPFVRF